MKRWSTADEDYLKDNYGRFSIERIAQNLKRSEMAVKIKANRLGLKFGGCENGLTVSEIAQACSVSRAIVMYWIKRKELPVFKIKRGSCYIYKIRSRQFWKWAECNEKSVNLLYIKPKSILPEPKWLEKKVKNCKRQPPKKRRCITRDEIKRVKQMYYSGTSVEEISRRIDRPIGSVRQMLRKKSV